MPSPSLASYVKSASPLQNDGDKTAFKPPIAPPMREVSLPFPAPRYCGDFAIHIRRDGTWCYQNSPIRRQALCRLFASVLYKDADGQHWLITPAERGRITVELAPFLVAQCQYKDGELQLKTTLDEWRTVDNDHPLFTEQRTPQSPRSFLKESSTIPQETPPPNIPSPFPEMLPQEMLPQEMLPQEMLPYVCLDPQRRLDALIARSVFYELAQLAEYDEQQNIFFIRSGEKSFALAEPTPASK